LRTTRGAWATTVVPKVQPEGYIALATLPLPCVCYFDTSKPLHNLIMYPIPPTSFPFGNTYSCGHHLKYGNDGWLGPRYQRRCHCGRVYNHTQACLSFLNTPTKGFSRESPLASAHPDTHEDYSRGQHLKFLCHAASNSDTWIRQCD
jgi:hypothetical protein